MFYRLVILVLWDIVLKCVLDGYPKCKLNIFKYIY
nr:MAG TPA: hypothetical protein [Bacteriophage sp.]